MDKNCNGAMDTGENGIANVVVTDGVTCTATDPSGAFVITLSTDPVLKSGGFPSCSVTVPSGYKATTPWYRLIREIPENAPLNFGLQKQRQDLPFTFIHGTDCHVPRNGKNMFISFRHDVMELADKIKFCILTGDITDLSDSNTFEKAGQDFDFFKYEAENFPVPLFSIPGNHDIAGVRAHKGWDKSNPMYGYGFFTSCIGPLRWSFNYAGIHFAGIDFALINKNGGWGLGVPEVAVKWLKQDLSYVKKDSRVFLFVHFPKGCKEFKKALADKAIHPVEYIFHGHDHVDRKTILEGIPCISSGSLSQIFRDKDREPGYRIVRVTKNGLDTFYRKTSSQHAITVDIPRFETIINQEQVVRGAFYDPNNEITSLAVKLGKNTKNVEFKRGPVCCRFETTFALNPSQTKKIFLTVTISNGKKSWSFKHLYKKGPFPKVH